jgi:hypothetical protein
VEHVVISNMRSLELVADATESSQTLTDASEKRLCVQFIANLICVRALLVRRGSISNS